MAAAVSTFSQDACTDTRGAGAICSSRPAASAGLISSRAAWSACFIIYRGYSLTLFADVADLGRRATGRIRRFGVLAFAIFLDHRGAPHRIGCGLAARLHQIGRAGDHGREIALRGAAEVPVRLVL